MMNDTSLDIKYMKLALKMAQKAAQKKEVPIGAIIVDANGKIMGKGYNLRETKQNPTYHAEMIAIQKAAKKKASWRLDNCTLYVTLEPCPMCAGAILQSRIKRVVYGASDPKGGCVGTLINLYDVVGFNHYPEYTGGVLAEDCGKILRDFFQQLRKEKKC